MSLSDEARRAPTPVEALRVEHVADRARLRTFTEVQAAGFAAGPEEHESLFAWMWDKNRRAVEHADQHYYCLRRDGEAVSVLLTVDTGDALGIYAVATPPARRREGLSSYLLKQVCAAAPDTAQICLQVMRGSYAEHLYAKLGFAERFVVDVYKSAARPA